MDLLVMVLAFVSFVLLVYFTTREKSLFKMECKDCGHKYRDWKVVPIGHDDFAWQHNCGEDRCSG